jgi:hypothetical protein
MRETGSDYLDVLLDSVEISHTRVNIKIVYNDSIQCLASMFSGTGGTSGKNICGIRFAGKTQ